MDAASWGAGDMRRPIRLPSVAAKEMAPGDNSVQHVPKFSLQRQRLSSEILSKRHEYHVALVCMPFTSIIRPSIQLGLLKAIAVSHGFPTTTFHLNLDFAKQIDSSVYEAICESGRSFVGDWLFSAAAFRDDAPDYDASFLEGCGSTDDVLSRTLVVRWNYLLKIRSEEVPKYLDRLMEQVNWERFNVVGFTSTFQQHVASIALAVRLKEVFPWLTVVFGGANCEGEMGIEFARTISCADYVFIGEADQAFPAFLMAVQEGRDPATIPGVVCRRNGSVTQPRSSPPFDRLDDLPTPDYDEFFERAENLGLLTRGPRREVRIPFESARGCWWGAKHHCTFCGLNGQNMAFRAKSPTRVLAELRDAAIRYRSFSFSAVDNIIDLAYLKTLCVDLVKERTDYDIFYEVKANLRREQIKLLRDAGIRRLQPGIESLNTHILKLMEKGISGINNVNTLRWAQYYGVDVAWNLLYGFPGETLQDYIAQNALLRKIFFLQPPGGAGRIWMERFSPIFQNRIIFPTRRLTPLPAYRHIYPAQVNLDQLAYFFDYEFENTLPESTFDEMKEIVAQWRKLWENEAKPRLRFWSTRGFLLIEDRRDVADPGTYTFEDHLASLYTALVDRPTSAAAVKDELTLGYPVEEIEAALDEFCSRDLMIRDGNLFLALALPATVER